MNLSIDRDDFDPMPLLQPLGGWGAANRAFTRDRMSDTQRFTAMIAVTPGFRVVTTELNFARFVLISALSVLKIVRVELVSAFSR